MEQDNKYLNRRTVENICLKNQHVQAFIHISGEEAIQEVQESAFGDKKISQHLAEMGIQGIAK